MLLCSSLNIGDLNCPGANCTAQAFFRKQQSLSYARNYPPFAEPGGSLPLSQEPLTGPLLNQWIYSIYLHPISIRSILKLCFHLYLGFPVFPDHNFAGISDLSHTCLQNCGKCINWLQVIWWWLLISRLRFSGMRQMYCWETRCLHFQGCDLKMGVEIPPKS
jgi:hypothetical protein